jgi:hypothetical protein
MLAVPVDFSRAREGSGEDSLPRGMRESRSFGRLSRRSNGWTVLDLGVFGKHLEGRDKLADRGEHRAD